MGSKTWRRCRQPSYRKFGWRLECAYKEMLLQDETSRRKVGHAFEYTMEFFFLLTGCVPLVKLPNRAYSVAGVIIVGYEMEGYKENN